MESGDGLLLQNFNEDKKKDLARRFHLMLKRYESSILSIQRLLVWEDLAKSLTFITFIHVLFIYLTAKSGYAIGYLSYLVLFAIWLDLWKDKIWPEIRAVEPDPLSEWGELHPRLLGLYDMCELIACTILSCKGNMETVMAFRSKNPGKFCAMSCMCCLVLGGIGRVLPGAVIAYVGLLVILILPAMCYHRLLEKAYSAAEPYLMQLQYLLKQRPGATYQLIQKMSSNRLAWQRTNTNVDELAEFMPPLDDKTAAALAKALTDDSGLSDEEEEILANELPSFSQFSAVANEPVKEEGLDLPTEFHIGEKDFADEDDEDMIGIPRNYDKFDANDFTDCSRLKAPPSTVMESMAASVMKTTLERIVKETVVSVAQSVGLHNSDSLNPKPQSSIETLQPGENVEQLENNLEREISTSSSDFEIVDYDYVNVEDNHHGA